MNNIININSQLNEMFYSFLENLNAISQIITPDSDKPLVRHNKMDQLSYVVEGKGYVATGNETQTIKKGDLVFIPKTTAHSFLVTNDTMELLHYHWPKEFMDNDREILENLFMGWGNYLNGGMK
jgi:mannose-6-phosphate isomerase-like protein (cupin superfamily)